MASVRSPSSHPPPLPPSCTLLSHPPTLPPPALPPSPTASLLCTLSVAVPLSRVCSYVRLCACVVGVCMCTYRTCSPTIERVLLL